MENRGRVESVLFDGNDFRQNFTDGVCIANAGDFTRSRVLNNTFDNNGIGEPIAPAAPFLATALGSITICSSWQRRLPAKRMVILLHLRQARSV
jgi:hypothetical protein